MIKTLLFTLLAFISFFAKAEQPIQYTYDEVAANIFWHQLYGDGGWTLYCGLKFNRPNISEDLKTLAIEHIYTTSRIINTLGCQSRRQCYEQNKRFLVMEADLHNLYPVRLDLSNALYDSEFGEIEGDDWRVGDCDFERKNGFVQPRLLARGNVARSIFYMHNRYKLPIKKDTLEILKRWNKEDPPSQQEIVRNDKIEKIQGNRNPYIDDPTLADKLSAQ